jgi:sugar phosphate isomerase/epimerase
MGMRNTQCVTIRPNAFGAGFTTRPLKSPDPEVRRRNLEDVRQVVEFCAAIACPSVMMLPGVIHAGASKADAIQRCIEASQELLAISQPAGIAIAIEPHAMGLLESPSDTLAVLEGAPGLKLALDYVHFITLGYTQPDVDPLCAFAAHVHLRQAKPGFLQTRLEHGTLNFPALLDSLRQTNYNGCRAVEYAHQDYMQTDNVDVISETVKLRNRVRAHL